MDVEPPGKLLLEKYFRDGRRAQVVRLDDAVLARVFAPSGRPYLEVAYDDVGEATTTIMEWNGEGWPLSRQQERR